ncbi:hypothetical protein LTR37_020654 [Vermiconidia calcicola]|uniref:Uncharacterized protein n=1 Tax=Vermiconidia calcicola TaxID=1690605 RepID=A0ACC3MC21_9PEZI|nr:hypothetical protein LTR37_020654 [Vermiconidia calcicola]
MVATKAHLKAFIKWETKAAKDIETTSRNKSRNREQQLLAEWDQRTDKVAYATIVQDLPDLIQKADKLAKKAQKPPKILKKDTNETARDKHREFQGTVRLALDARRAVLPELRKLRDLQEATDRDGDIVTNERSRNYTTRLHNEAQTAINELQRQFTEHRETRQGLGSAVASRNGSQDGEDEGQDEQNEQGDQQEQQEQQEQGEAARGKGAGQIGNERVPEDGEDGPAKRMRRSEDVGGDEEAPAAKRSRPSGRRRSHRLPSTSQPSEDPLADIPSVDAQDESSCSLRDRWGVFLASVHEDEKLHPFLAEFQDLVDKVHVIVALGYEAPEPPKPDSIAEADPENLVAGLEQKVNDAERTMANERQQMLDEMITKDPDKKGDVAYHLGVFDAKLESPIGKDWAWGGTIGVGGHGHAGLWIQYDEQARIKARIVLKETYLGNMWDDEGSWYGDMWERLPLEVALHERVSTRAGSSAVGIVRFRASAVYPDLSMYRTYCEFCEHGDLWKAMILHWNLKDSYRKLGTPKEEKCHIPPYAMWAIFASLAKAVCFLKYGAILGQTKPKTWDAIIHRDIKSPNVFLAKPREDAWRSVPEPKLGDFGLALLADDDHAQLVPSGTPGYRAPEQDLDTESKKTSGFDVTCAADIFAIGAVIIHLMNLDDEPHLRQRKYANPETSAPLELQKAAKRLYPDELVEILMRCLEMLPRNRVDAWELCEEIRAEVEQSRENGVSLVEGKLDQDHDFWYKEDIYRRHLART